MRPAGEPRGMKRREPADRKGPVEGIRSLRTNWWRRRELNREGARVFSNLHETLRVGRLGKLPFACNRVRISYATHASLLLQLVRRN